MSPLRIGIGSYGFICFASGLVCQLINSHELICGAIAAIAAGWFVLGVLSEKVVK